MSTLSSNHLVMGIHGRLTLSPDVRALIDDDDDQLGPDPAGMFIDRSVALGLMSFRPTTVDEDPSATELSEGTERWSQHEASGDWGSDGRLAELLAFRIELDKMGTRTQQRLPILPAMAAAQDIFSRIGQVNLTGIYAELPLHIASDALRDVARGRHWFESAAHQVSTDFYVTMDIYGPTDWTSAESQMLAELAPLIAGHDPVLPSVAVVDRNEAAASESECFSGEPASLVFDGDNMPPPAATVSLRCRGVEWSLDLAAWTIEWFGELARRSTQTQRVAIRLALAT